ncbi:MAG: hypothetical protein ACQESG_07670 [Nanobdellota archaeon]
MEKKEMKMPANVQPVYADEANVNANVKINIEKDEAGNEQVRKAGKVDVMFFDQFTNSVVSRVVIDPFTAKVLSRVLHDNAEKLINELESKEVPQQVKDQISQKKEHTDTSVNTYIG